ncbi:MAG: flavodoxin family protein [Candidatus Omnitrophota bacterium]|nr:flavodoxin family protein [Candidatus Omnitrophota bacterium]
MKILGISASPRMDGNTDIFLNKALDGAIAKGAKTDKIFLRDLRILPIQEAEYEAVNSEGFSVTRDDMEIIYRKLRECDAVILASPIFFGSLSSLAKTMIDRFQCVWLAKNILNKTLYPTQRKGAFICVEASFRVDFFENAKSIVRHFFATTNIKYEKEIFCPGVDKKGKVLEKPGVLQEAYELGIQLVC